MGSRCEASNRDPIAFFPSTDVVNMIRGRKLIWVSSDVDAASTHTTDTSLLLQTDYTD